MIKAIFFFYYCFILPFIWLGKKIVWTFCRDTENQKKKAEKAVLRKAQRKGKLHKYQFDAAEEQTTAIKQWIAEEQGTTTKNGLEEAIVEDQKYENYEDKQNMAVNRGIIKVKTKSKQGVWRKENVDLSAEVSTKRTQREEQLARHRVGRQQQLQDIDGKGVPSPESSKDSAEETSTSDGESESGTSEDTSRTSDSQDSEGSGSSSEEETSKTTSSQDS